MEQIAELIGWYVVFIISASLHEACHAWAAMRGGDLTAFHGGQVSLDPMPHIRREPFGMVVLPIISLLLMGWPFGFASAPYDPQWARQHPRRSAYMALAGPAGNLLLVIIAAILIRLGMIAGYFHTPESISITHIAAASTAGPTEGIAKLISMLFTMNLLLMTLNLIPLPPLDGSDVITLFMKPQVIDKYRDLINKPGVGIIGLILIWNLFDYILSPIFTIAISCLYPGSTFS